ncbi:PaaX family transcriptional regulator C-terminal domain-containing protein [Actinopolymorpha singaporensis]|uniref:Transcriptional regulator, PaaX family n=1 Tax=Actinopolymorpha singaporensis TaxID=117157 RepID=A0A1H1YU21_9ACTN|nr:PaaX family transcriptional regulator C-terminal domain-containing protein [Actinopolymorpha singaporensis]SDT24870.1 transcriptional regulator, PaaX family [Actinopolymorpha singaporensis]
MRARSALFDLYGDHLRSRGGRAPVAALVQLLAPLGINPAAVRTAVSRMVRQGWLTSVRTPGGPGYALTGRAVRRLDEAAGRIYRTRGSEWDGTWHLLVLPHVPDRSLRERLHAGLAFLGYARLGGDTWLAPRRSGEAESLLAADGVRADGFTARDLGDPAELAARAFDLTALGTAYQQWLRDARTHAWADTGVEADGLEGGGVEGVTVGEDADRRAFAARSRLVHEWRKFLFTDPGLPSALLPADWPGDAAAAYFDTHAAALLPAAARFVDTCLAQTGGTT